MQDEDSGSATDSDRLSDMTTAQEVLEKYRRPPSPTIEPVLGDFETPPPEDTPSLDRKIEQLRRCIPEPHDSPDSPVRPSLERIAADYLGLADIPRGWLDNAIRRQSQQSIALRVGHNSYERSFAFKARIFDNPIRRAPFTDKGVRTKRSDAPLDTKSDSDGSEDEDSDMDGEDNDIAILRRLRTPVPLRGSDSLRRLNVIIETPADRSIRESDRQLRFALTIIKAGAEKARADSNKSSKYALPRTALVPELEVADGDFRLTAHQRDGIGQLRHLEIECGAWGLSDDPGLGKTLQAIVLFILERGKEPTLVVVPLGLIPYWKGEFARVPSLTVGVYYEEGKTMTQDAMLNFDIVLTTYETIAREYAPIQTALDDWPNVRMGETNKIVKPGKRKGSKDEFKTVSLQTTRAHSKLYTMCWHRVVLDEAHRIRNIDTGVSKAACSLQARVRGYITGTPMQNDYSDIYALARFLHLEPWNRSDIFHQCFIHKVKTNRPISSAASPLDNDMANALAAVRNFFTVRRKRNQMFDGEPITGVRDPIHTDVFVHLDADAQSVQDEIRDLWDTAYRAVLVDEKKEGESSGPPDRPDVLKELTHGQLNAMHPQLLEAKYGDLGTKDLGLPSKGDVDERLAMVRGTSIEAIFFTHTRLQLASRREKSAVSHLSTK